MGDRDVEGEGGVYNEGGVRSKIAVVQEHFSSQQVSAALWGVCAGWIWSSTQGSAVEGASSQAVFA